jgi:ribosomal protein S27AE
MSVSAQVIQKVNKTTNIKEYKKEHYQKNKGYILTFHKQRVQCEKCGKDLAYSSRASHVKNNRCKFLVDLVGNIVPPSDNPDLLVTDFPDLKII